VAAMGKVQLGSALTPVHLIRAMGPGRDAWFRLTDVASA
jgi:hypothetical protein